MIEILKPLFVGGLVATLLIYLLLRRKRNQIIEHDKERAMIHNSSAGIALGFLLILFGALHFVLLPETTWVMVVAGSLFIITGLVIMFMYYKQRRERLLTYSKK